MCGALAILMIVVWMWPSDPPPAGRVDIGGNVTLPTYVSGPLGHSWWASVILMLVVGSLYISWIFSYLYLWIVSPDQWRAAAGISQPTYGIASVALLIVSGINVTLAGRFMTRSSRSTLFTMLMIISLLALCGALATDLTGYWNAGWRPSSDGHGALVGMGLVLQAQLTAAVTVMGLFAVARLWSGRLHMRRRVVFDNTRLCFSTLLCSLLWACFSCTDFRELFHEPSIRVQ